MTITNQNQVASRSKAEQTNLIPQISSRERRRHVHWMASRRRQGGPKRGSSGDRRTGRTRGTSRVFIVTRVVVFEAFVRWNDDTLRFEIDRDA